MTQTVYWITVFTRSKLKFKFNIPANIITRFEAFVANDSPAKVFNLIDVYNNPVTFAKGVIECYVEKNKPHELTRLKKQENSENRKSQNEESI